MFFVFGLAIGSYLNVCIYRIPRDIPTYIGRSVCPACKEKIAWYDLVPIISYIVLGGKCRRCGARISPRYAAVELLTGLLWAAAYITLGLSIECALACVMLSVLTALAFIDADNKIIPDRFVLIILVLGVINTFISGGDYLGHVIGFFAVSVPLFIIALITGGMGGGDIKLMAAAGLYLGWKGALASLIIGSVIGAAAAVWLLICKKAGRKSEIPFGPFLAIGIGAAALFGDRLIGWYLALLL